MQLIMKWFVLVLFFVYTFEFNFSIFKITNNSNISVCYIIGFPFRVLPICVYVLFGEIDVELFLTHINKNMFCVHACYWVSRRLWTISDCYVSSLGLSGFFLMLFSFLVDLSTLHLLEQCRSIYFEFMQLHRCFGH